MCYRVGPARSPRCIPRLAPAFSEDCEHYRQTNQEPPSCSWSGAERVDLLKKQTGPARPGSGSPATVPRARGLSSRNSCCEPPTAPPPYLTTRAHLIDEMREPTASDTQPTFHVVTSRPKASDVESPALLLRRTFGPPEQPCPPADPQLCTALSAREPPSPSQPPPTPLSRPPPVRHESPSSARDPPTTNPAPRRPITTSPAGSQPPPDLTPPDPLGLHPLRLNLSFDLRDAATNR